MRCCVSLILIVALLLASCVKKPEEPVKIAINPWPGYEFLYLAEQKGFFEEAGLNLRLVQMSSLSDTQRAYINGQVDGLTGTLIETLNANQLSNNPLKVVMVPDYSNGGDVIVARKGIQSIRDLKGKSIGCEVGALGIYILQRALAHSGLSLEDVNIVNTEQLNGERDLLDGTLDAFVTYPPVSIDILKHQDFHTVFSSADIPREIIDVVAISAATIAANPELVAEIRKVWQKALDFAASNPAEAYTIMARRQGISANEFEAALSDLVVLSSSEQRALFQTPQTLQRSIEEVCKTMVYVKSLDSDCATLPSMVYQGL